MIKLQDIAPANIEKESFRIIEAEFEQQTGIPVDAYSPDEFAVIRRVIHATGDFSLATSITFQHDPIEAATSALKSGGNVLTDVNMVASGVSKKLLSNFGGKVICGVSEPETVILASEKGVTRSEAAMRRYASESVAILAIGNAPTALIAAINLIERGLMNPGVIVGVPVGFVNAEESKEMLKRITMPAITVTGRRGGSPIAAAITNALLHITREIAVE